MYLSHVRTILALQKKVERIRDPARSVLVLGI